MSIAGLYRNIFTCLWRLLRNPVEAWDQLAARQDGLQQVRSRFLYPLCYLAIAEAGVCGILQAPAGRWFGYTVLYAATTAIVLFASYFVVCSLSVPLANGRTAQPIDRSVVLSAVSYCFSGYVVVRMIVVLAGSLFFIRVLYIYNVYMVWQATRAFFGMDEDRRSGLTLLLGALIIFVPGIVRLLIGALLPKATLL